MERKQGEERPPSARAAEALMVMGQTLRREIWKGREAIHKTLLPTHLKKKKREGSLRASFPKSPANTLIGCVRTHCCYSSVISACVRQGLEWLWKRGEIEGRQGDHRILPVRWLRQYFPFSFCYRNWLCLLRRQSERKGHGRSPQRRNWILGLFRKCGGEACANASLHVSACLRAELKELMSLD